MGKKGSSRKVSSQKAFSSDVSGPYAGLQQFQGMHGRLKAQAQKAKEVVAKRRLNERVSQLKESKQMMKEEYKSGHAKIRKRALEKKAGRTILKNWREKKRNEGAAQAAKTGIRESIAGMKKDYHRFKNDAGYRKEVIDKTKKSVISGAITGLSSTAAKVGGGALAGYLAGQSKNDDEEEEEKKKKQ